MTDRGAPFATWTRTVAPDPDDLPVGVTDFKLHARIVQSAGDATLLQYLNAALDAAEAYLGYGLTTQTWRLELSDFARAIPLPMASPLQNASGMTPTVPVIQYYDTAGVLQTLAASYYTVDTTSRPGRILRAPNQYWPSLECDRAGARVFITYVVGQTDPDDVPERIKQGLRLYASAQEVDRDGTNAMARTALEDAAKRCWDDRIDWPEPQWCDS